MSMQRNAGVSMQGSAPPSKQPGFTIVEVMIALAIAGLIMYMVFLAIPTLQRNSRNNQRKQDVSAILQAISQYELTNSANFPPNTTTLLAFTKLSFYDRTTQVSLLAAPPGIVGPNTNIDSVDIYGSERCDPASPGTTDNKGADYRDIVALYAIETSGAPQSKCEQL